MKYLFLVLLFVVLLFSALLLYPVVFLTPSNERDWSPDQIVLPEITYLNNKVEIKHVRNIKYHSTDDYDIAFYDRVYDLDRLKRAWLMIEPFDSFGAAHTLISFEFQDDVFLAVSVEIRKEIGEEFSPLKGMLGAYELAYVIADENDVIKLRTNYRKDTVRLYPIKADKEKLRLVLKDMLDRAHTLRKHPEFYNTITNNCTTNIARHARRFSNKQIPWYDIRYLLPATSDAIAYRLGLIDTNLPLKDARERYNITKRAESCADAQNFSLCIRKGFKFDQ